MFVALVLMCAGLYYSNPNFLGQSNVLNTTRQVSMLGIYAIGIGFVIITGGIDLSIGSVVGLTGVLIAKLSSHATGGMGYPMFVGIGVAMLVALLIGWAQGLLITRLKLQPFIVTLGGMLLIRGVSQTIAEGGTLSFGTSAFRRLANAGLFNPPDVLPDFSLAQLATRPGLVYALKNLLAVLSAYPTLIFIATIIVSAYVLHSTVFGRYVYAIGGNRDAAEYSGINVKRVETSTYVISAGLGGVAGICYAAYIGQMSQQVGIAYELYAIAAAVLGGCSLRGGEGTVFGIIIGSAIMKVIDNGIIMAVLPGWAQRVFQVFGYKSDKLDTNWTFIIIGGVIIVAVVLDQLVHIAQEKRRIRRAGEVVAARQRAGDAAAAAVAGGTKGGAG
jgi:ribose transport system permease protein